MSPGHVVIEAAFRLFRDGYGGEPDLTNAEDLRDLLQCIEQELRERDRRLVTLFDRATARLEARP